MRVMFACLCDYASVDENGKLSACGIFDRITQTKFPAGLSRMFFVLRLKFEYEDNEKVNQLVIDLIDADARSVKSFSYTIEHSRTLPGQFNALNFVLELTDTIIAQPGRYIWVLKPDDAPPLEVQFDVVEAAPP